MRTFRVYGHDDECEKSEPGALCYYSDVVPILNSLQQLKAEIAALASELDCIQIRECDIANFEDIIKRMRQLSALSGTLGESVPCPGCGELIVIPLCPSCKVK